jgi:hypothetical protein
MIIDNNFKNNIKNIFIWCDRKDTSDGQYDESTFTKTSIISYDSNKNIYERRVEFAGVFSSQTKTWTWAWALPQTIFEEDTINNHLLNYAIKINNMDSINMYVKAMLTTSNIKFNNKYELDIHITLLYKLAGFICENIYKDIKYLNKMQTEYEIYYYYVKKVI